MSYLKLDSNKTVHFDVDSTIIDYRGDEAYDKNPADHLVYRREGSVDDLWIKPILRHVRLMRELKNIGYTIVVWSRTGSDHAEYVTKLLGIEKYVDLIMSKPEIIVDDLPIEKQGIHRIFKV